MFYFNPIFLIVILFCATFSIVFLCSLLDICIQEICYRCCINRQNISTEIQPQHETQKEDNIKEYIVIKNPGGHPISIGIV